MEKLFGIIPIKKEYFYAAATSIILSGLAAVATLF
jgi:hypothetical protein